MTPPLGIRLLALFFAFGATMSGLTAFLLGAPQILDALSPLLDDRVGRFLDYRLAELQPLGGWAVLLMLAVSASCATACVGLWRRRIRGFWTAVAVLTVNMLGDSANALINHDWRTLIGLPIGAAMIAYLVSRRRFFI